MDPKSKISFYNNLGYLFGKNFTIVPKGEDDISELLSQLLYFDYSSKLCSEKVGKFQAQR